MLNKDQLFKKGVVLVMGEKHCIVMICLILKQKRSWCVEPIRWSAKSTNEQNKCLKKKNSSALIILEEAADVGCWISLSNGHFSRCLFLTESVDELIKRLSHFKIIPKSSSNCFLFLLVFCFLKLQTKVRSPTSSSKNNFVTDSWVSAGPPLCSEYSLCSSSVSSFQEGKYIQYIHYLYPLELAHADELL